MIYKLNELDSSRTFFYFEKHRQIENKTQAQGVSLRDTGYFEES